MRKLVLFLLVAVVSSVVWAQAPVGSISGVVKDQTGAVLVGAKIAATSLADAGVRSVTSNDQGYFIVPTLLPGAYKLVIEAKGFRLYEVQRVTVEVGQSARVDASLSVGAESISVEVAGGDVVGVDTQQATV